MPPRKLVFTNDTDWFVAHDMGELREVFVRMYGPKEDFYPDEWRCLGDDETVKITDHDASPVVRGGGTASGMAQHPSEVKTAREWADVTEPGILCSTEF